MEWGPGGAKSAGKQSLSLQGAAPSGREVREGVKEQVHGASQACMQHSRLHAQR